MFFYFFFFQSCKENCALFFFTTLRFNNATEKFVFRPFCLRLFFFFRRGPNLEIARCYLPFCVYFRGYSLVQARGTIHQIWEKRSYPGTFRCVLDIAVYNSGALHLSVYVILLNQMLCCFIPICNFYSSFYSQLISATTPLPGFKSLFQQINISVFLQGHMVI